MDTIQLGPLRISRLIIGSNPFSGFSHQNPETDRRMKHYFTVARIKETLRTAESLGIDAVMGRTDQHVMRFLVEYWDEGSSIQWLSQTCPAEGTPEMCIQRAVEGSAKACHIHGGYMDFLLAQRRMNEVQPLIDMIRKAGMPAGIAGHNPDVFRYAEDHLDADYYACSYYNSARRDERPQHVSGMSEWFLEEDRKIMTDLIQGLSRPVIHYKIMAAGRNDPREAFACVARAMRPQDAACVGIYTENSPSMLAEDVRLFTESIAAGA